MTSSPIHDIKLLVQSFHPIIVVDSVEEERAEALVAAAAADMGMPVFVWTAPQGLCRRGGTGMGANTREVDKALLHLDTLEIEMIVIFKDLGPHLESAVTSRRLRELAQRFTRTQSTMIIIGARTDLPKEVAHMAVRLQVALPDAEELGRVLDTTVGSLGGARIELDDEGRGHIINALRGLTLNQARQAIATVALQDGLLDMQDYAAILARKAQSIRDAGLLEYLPAGENGFQLGGFARLKAWLDRAAMGFSAQAREWNLQAPRGILLTGVQGCGKSLAAKAIAARWHLPLLKLDAGRLYNKYIGESEGNLRRAIEMAESIAPVLLWIDEIEKAFGAADGETDGGTSQRLLGTFLTWLQEKRETVFVVGTSNDVFRLPPELLRKGRFDEIFFVDLPDANERREILAIHLNLKRQDPAHFDLDLLSAHADGFSGAELEQVVVSGLYACLYHQRPLTTEDLLNEITQTVPLSRSRAEDIANLRAVARERFVPAA